MTVHHCLIALRPEARALSVAHFVRHWLDHLVKLGLVTGWWLTRRKFGFASRGHTDFMLGVEGSARRSSPDASLYAPRTGALFAIRVAAPSRESPGRDAFARTTQRQRFANGRLRLGPAQPDAP